jgi:hypothetical protein
VKQLAAALIAAQADMPAVKPDAKNPHYKSDYVSLDHLIATTRPVLTKHGLAIAQFPSHLDGRPALITRLIHVSGEMLEEATPLLLTKQDMQGMGTAQTYARRYGWAAVLGVSAEDDDDAERASEPDLPDTLKAGDDPSLKPENPVPEQNRLITDAQLRLLWKTWRETGLEDERLRDLILEVTGQASTKGIRRAQVDEVMAGIARLAVEAPVRFEAPETVQEQLA